MEKITKKLIAVARGDEKADLVIKNVNIVNVFDCSIGVGDIAVCGGVIAGIGKYSGVKEIDMSGKYAIPGLIDGHMHIESTQLTPEELAKAILPHGTTTVIADPHEITNVCGIEGVKYIAKASENIPLDVKIMLPSCVPATPFENSGAVINGEDTEKFIKEPYVYGYGEYMNFPGVTGGADDDLKKLNAAKSNGKIIDGHAPNLGGNMLNAYLAGGIKTDHECIGEKEITEKIRRGVYVHLREGSATKNAAENCKYVNAANMRRFLVCTDDRHACDLKKQGHIDNALRIIVNNGVNPVWAVVMATLNNAECYGLKDRGALAPSYAADIVVVDDLKSFEAKLVIKDGKVVAENGKALFGTEKYVPENVLGTVNIKPLEKSDFDIKVKSDKVNVIRLLHNNVVTEKVVRTVPVNDGKVEVKGTDLLKLAVVERHKATGNVGLGLIEGYGLKNGAIALTVSHDSHNIIVLGDDSGDMLAAVNELKRIGGGMVIVENGKVADSLPLEIAGLISKLEIGEFEKRLAVMIDKAYAMGVAIDIQPFMSLSFLALVVIPEIKITDRGLFDVNKFGFIPLEA